MARIVSLLMEAHSLSQIATDIGVVAFFIVLGSFFVAAEIALISLRDSQVKQLATKSKRGARVALLAENPNRFLSAVQVGVTLCGFLSAAIGAERLSIYLEPVLIDLGLSDSLANILALVGITLVVAYFSLVFGELAPKRIALSRAENIAMGSASIIDTFAKLFRPVIWLLATPH